MFVKPSSLKETMVGDCSTELDLVHQIKTNVLLKGK